MGRVERDGKTRSGVVAGKGAGEAYLARIYLLTTEGVVVGTHIGQCVPVVMVVGSCLNMILVMVVWLVQ